MSNTGNNLRIAKGKRKEYYRKPIHEKSNKEMFNEFIKERKRKIK